MKCRITVLPGDGIGPEVIAQATRVLRAIGRQYGHDFEFHEHLIGGAAIRAHGTPLPEATISSCLASDAVLLGAVGGPEFDSLPSGSKPESGLLGLRRALGGFANLRPAVCPEYLANCSPLRPEVVAGADIMIVRELLGGAYFGEPRKVAETEGFNTMRYSTAEVERVARVGFEIARTRRKKLTSVDKANVLEVSQLWRKVVTSLSAQYPDVMLEHMYVDACAMKLVTSPASFDVIVTENLFGDILSDEAAVLTGSLGMLASATIGGEVDLYEPVHGSAPDIAGKGIANPLGAIASAAMLLRYTAKLSEPADAVETAIKRVLMAGHRTADIARSEPKVSTERMGELIEAELQAVAPELAAISVQRQQ
ncbi:MAG TPA: 3-isopropylmalate dehydrogenase [Terriglobales bacterium]|nr:3-isopropylmalate dehydrogenase [Terriglobales bacterium]